MKISKLPILLASFSLIIIPASTQAASHDCDNNAITYCGADTKTELLSKISHGDGRHDSDDLQGIYNGRGMTTAAINSADTVDGIVTRDGNVMVGGKTVATGALTTGRQDMPGSTLNADTLYVRPPSVSFKQSQLDAWVYMSGGVFRWAIIKACGNPVTANPIAPPVLGKGGGARPVPSPPAPRPQPTSAPESKPAPIVTPQPPKTTPKTGGSENGMSILGLSLIGIAGWYYRKSTQRLESVLRNCL